jgi:hypothetical protein
MAFSAKNWYHHDSQKLASAIMRIHSGRGSSDQNSNGNGNNHEEPSPVKAAR